MNEYFNVNNEYSAKYKLFYTQPDNIHSSEPTYKSTYNFIDRLHTKSAG